MCDGKFPSENLTKLIVRCFGVPKNETNVIIKPFTNGITELETCSSGSVVLNFVVVFVKKFLFISKRSAESQNMEKDSFGQNFRSI